MENDKKCTECGRVLRATVAVCLCGWLSAEAMMNGGEVITIDPGFPGVKYEFARTLSDLRPGMSLIRGSQRVNSATEVVSSTVILLKRDSE